MHNTQTPIHFPWAHITLPSKITVQMANHMLELVQEHVTYVQVASDVNGYLAPSDALELVT